VLREGAERGDGTGDEASAQPTSIDEGDAALRCVRCGAAIARARDRIERFGAHLHERVNPAGYVFTIGCFSRADGARAEGDPSTDFAWFPKHAWQVAVCGTCGVHLGWSFTPGDGAGFWGLVLDKIAEG
jgi:hypothetical protein